MIIVLNGSDLTVEQIVEVAERGQQEITICEEASEVMARSRRVVMQAVERGDRVYGLTTGLGSKVTETLGADELAKFSIQTLRGRAHAIGDPLPVPLVRAAMLVRLNTLLKGASGADPAVAECLRSCLKANLTPVVGEIGSIGAGDLCMGATMGLSLSGQGKMFGPNGKLAESSELLRSAGLNPLDPGPRDGLALANHSSFTAAMFALNVHRTSGLIDALQSAAALSMEAFVANTSPLDPLASTMRPQPGQQEAAEILLRLLEGSAILDPGNARRLQDPLSFRNVAQVHGALLAAFQFARGAAESEINGASDNPVVDIERDRIISCGAYHTPLLTIAAQTVSTAMVHVAHTQLARISKMLSEKFTGLPQFLAGGATDSNGFAPVLKIAEALVAELTHAASSVVVWPSVNADGVEDIQTNSPVAIKALGKVLGLGEKLCAIELMVSAQSFELRGVAQAGPRIVRLVKNIRKFSEPLVSDRPVGDDIERLAEAITAQKL